MEMADDFPPAPRDGAGGPRTGSGGRSHPTGLLKVWSGDDELVMRESNRGKLREETTGVISALSLPQLGSRGIKWCNPHSSHRLGLRLYSPPSPDLGRYPPLLAGVHPCQLH